MKLDQIDNTLQITSIDEQVVLIKLNIQLQQDMYHYFSNIINSTLWFDILRGVSDPTYSQSARLINPI